MNPQGWQRLADTHSTLTAAQPASPAPFDDDGRILLQRGNQWTGPCEGWHASPGAVPGSGYNSLGAAALAAERIEAAEAEAEAEARAAAERLWGAGRAARRSR